MTGNHDSGDGGALPGLHDNSDIEARLSYFIQGYYEFTKDAADIYIRKCQLVLDHTLKPFTGGWRQRQVAKALRTKALR